MHQAGLQYRTINVYRSALSSVLPQVAGGPVGQHEDIKKVMRGAYNSRPPQPRYSAAWNVGQVLACLQSWGDNATLSLPLLSYKLVLLLALAKAPRARELQLLQSGPLQRRPDGVLLPLSAPTKTQQSGVLKSFFITSFDESLLCPVSCLFVYLQRTSEYRDGEKTPLFLALHQPHRPVASSTISRWLKTALGKCGVDTTAFSGHSTRSASTSAAIAEGVSMEVVLAAADWSGPSTFIKHYYRPTATARFAQAVLQADPQV